MDGVDFNLTIPIPYFTLKWGPFIWHFENKLPAGASIKSCNVKAFAGSITLMDDIESATDLTAKVIDHFSCSGTDVSVYFNHHDDAAGYVTIVFEIILESNSQRAFYHYALNVAQ